MGNLLGHMNFRNRFESTSVGGRRPEEIRGGGTKIFKGQKGGYQNISESKEGP